MPPEEEAEEAQIDAKVKEIDARIEDLQSQRRQLLQAKKSTPTKSTTSGPSLEQREQQSEFSEKTLEKAFNTLEWKEFKKREGEWAFLRTRNGDLVEDLKPIVDFIDQLRKGRRLAVGRYEYVASEDKFLNRYPRARDRT